MHQTIPTHQPCLFTAVRSRGEGLSSWDAGVTHSRVQVSNIPGRSSSQPALLMHTWSRPCARGPCGQLTKEEGVGSACKTPTTSSRLDYAELSEDNEPEFIQSHQILVPSGSKRQVLPGKQGCGRATGCQVRWCWSWQVALAAQDKTSNARLQHP